MLRDVIKEGGRFDAVVRPKRPESELVIDLEARDYDKFEKGIKGIEEAPRPGPNEEILRILMEVHRAVLQGESAGSQAEPATDAEVAQIARPSNPQPAARAPADPNPDLATPTSDQSVSAPPEPLAETST